MQEVEYGIRIKSVGVTGRVSLFEARTMLNLHGDDAELVQRTVTVGPWEPATIEREAVENP